MDNIFNFPEKAHVDRLIPKAKFIANSEMSKFREYITNQLESIRLLYVLAPKSLNVDAGKDVSEIDVFYCVAKEDGFGINTLCGMDGAIPRQTLFVVEHEGKIDLIMHHKTKKIANGKEVWERGVTEWKRDVSLDDVASIKLSIEGFNLDDIYYNLLKQVSDLDVSCRDEYQERAATRAEDQQRQKLIARLTVQMEKEKQPNKKLDLFKKIRDLQNNRTV